MADWNSRFPEPGTDDIDVPDDLFEQIQSVTVGGRRFHLYESRIPEVIEQIWQNDLEPKEGSTVQAFMAGFHQRHDDFEDRDEAEFELQSLL